MKRVHGVEVTDEQKQKMTKLTKQALSVYQKNRYAILEVDDGPESYETVAQLKDICGCVGIGMVSLNHYYHILYDVDNSKAHVEFA